MRGGQVVTPFRITKAFLCDRNGVQNRKAHREVGFSLIGPLVYSCTWAGTCFQAE